MENFLDNTEIVNLEEPIQLSSPVQACSPKEVNEVIHKNLSNKKSCRFDLITARILKELPIKGVFY